MADATDESVVSPEERSSRFTRVQSLWGLPMCSISATDLSSASMAVTSLTFDRVLSRVLIAHPASRFANCSGS